VSSAGAAGLQFVNLNATYPATFEPFSGAKLFTSVGSNISDTNFFLPGTNTPAFTNAFGVVFSDVDLANTTSVQFFDTSNNSLGTFFAPAGSGNETFSFLGVQFNAGEHVGRVRITSGNAALGASENLPGTDVVVMDDFIFTDTAAAAAVPEPEPGTASLIILGAGAALVAKRWRSSSRRSDNL
jgi:hypothetical protein